MIQSDNLYWTVSKHQSRGNASASARQLSGCLPQASSAGLIEVTEWNRKFSHRMPTLTRETTVAYGDMNPITFALNVSTSSQLAVSTGASSPTCPPGDPAAAYKASSFMANSCYLSLESGVENEFFRSSRKYMNTQR